jgi:hypothetical protein
MSGHPIGGFGVEPGVPAPPPPGPGVAPPFAAPPTDRNKRTLWIGLGVGGLIALLCCVGGVIGMGVIVASANDQSERNATNTVVKYLDAMKAQQIDVAYAQLCPQLARRMSRSSLRNLAQQRNISGYSLDDPLVGSSVDITAHIDTAAGDIEETYTLVPASEGDATRFEICGIT